MDYFDEMGWEPINTENTEQHQLILMLRFMRENGFWPESFYERELSPPASKEVVQTLEEIKYKQGGSDDEKPVKCAICLKTSSELDEGDPSREIVFKVLPCTHTFHDTCILPWLEKTNTCPLCRDELKTDDVVYEEMKRNRGRAKQRQEDLDTLHNSMFG